MIWNSEEVQVRVYYDVCAQIICTWKYIWDTFHIRDIHTSCEETAGSERKIKQVQAEQVVLRGEGRKQHKVNTEGVWWNRNSLNV